MCELINPLPEEFYRFFEQPGVSLLIRGAPGSGKTLLALSLAHHTTIRGGGEKSFFRLNESLS